MTVHRTRRDLDLRAVVASCPSCEECAQHHVDADGATCETCARASKTGHTSVGISLPHSACSEHCTCLTPPASSTCAAKPNDIARAKTVLTLIFGKRRALKHFLSFLFFPGPSFYDHLFFFFSFSGGSFFFLFSFLFSFLFPFLFNRMVAGGCLRNGTTPKNRPILTSQP